MGLEFCLLNADNIRIKMLQGRKKIFLYRRPDAVDIPRYQPDFFFLPLDVFPTGR